MGGQRHDSTSTASRTTQSLDFKLLNLDLNFGGTTAAAAAAPPRPNYIGVAPLPVPPSCPEILLPHISKLLTLQLLTQPTSSRATPCNHLSFPFLPLAAPSSRCNLVSRPVFAMVFIGVYRATYDYAPQDDNEIAITEGDLLFILEKGEDDWWKAKKKATSDQEEEPEGLVPSNYVEEVKPLAKAKAVYEYTRQTDEELSFAEDAVMEVFDTTDDDWTLVGLNGEYGFAPANYIEIAGSESEPAAPSLPSRPRPPPQVQHEPESDPEPEPLPPRRASGPDMQSPGAALAGILQSRTNGTRAASSSRPLPAAEPASLPARKRVQFTPEESDEEPVPTPRLPQRPPSDSFAQSPIQPSRSETRETRQLGRSFSSGSGENGGVITSPPHNRVVSAYFDEEKSLKSPGGFHLYNIYEMIEVMGKNRKTPVTLGINIAKGVIMISSEQSRESKEWTADKISNYSIEGKHVFMELIRPSRSIDFHAGAKDTAQEIVSALGELAGAAKAEGLREVLVASSGGQKTGKILYDFHADGDDEVSVSIDDNVIILDSAKSDEWWMVRRLKNGKEGVVPSSYVEITGTVQADVGRPPKSSKPGVSFVDQNRQEEERLAREASRSSRPAEVGPGLALPERGSSLARDGNHGQSSQKAKSRDGRSDKKSSKFPPSSPFDDASDITSARQIQSTHVDRSLGDLQSRGRVYWPSR
jgi:hypothetical protein